jgi:hypothetical protein
VKSFHSKEVRAPPLIGFAGESKNRKAFRTLEPNLGHETLACKGCLDYAGQIEAMPTFPVFINASRKRAKAFSRTLVGFQVIRFFEVKTRDLALVDKLLNLNAGGSLRSNLAELLVRKDQDLSRIRFQRVAESTGKEIPAEEIVKATRLKRINT